MAAALTTPCKLVPAEPRWRARPARSCPRRPAGGSGAVVPPRPRAAPWPLRPPRARRAAGGGAAGSGRGRIASATDTGGGSAGRSPARTWRLPDASSVCSPQPSLMWPSGQRTHRFSQSTADLGGGACVVRGVEQAEAVGAHLQGVGLAPEPGAGQTHDLDAPAMAPVPPGRRDGAEPVRGDGSDGVQRRPRRLGHEFQAAEDPNGGSTRGLKVAASAAGLREALLSGDVQQPVEQAPGGITLKEPGPELAQRAEVDAGVVQIERNQVLPLDAAACGVGCLPVAEPAPCGTASA